MFKMAALPRAKVTQQRADEQQWRSQINCYYLVKHRRVGRFQITPACL